LQWQTARHATPDLPFLCGDVTPRRLRVPEGDIRAHPNGVTGVAAIAVGVHDLEASLTRYRALLGTQIQGNAAPFVLPGSGLHMTVLPLAATRLVVMSPASPEAVAGEPEMARSLRQRLGARGEGPCAITLRIAEGHEAATLDVVRTHGVVFDLLKLPPD
jgi:hypothetical protein